MPQRTRKEKIAAEQKTIERYSILDNTRDILPKKVGKKVANLSTNKEEDETTKKYFLIDFKKSLVLVSLIIALEIILHFARIVNYFTN